jgi:hypothetical protein
MKARSFFGVMALAACSAGAVFAQNVLTVYDPLKEAVETKLNAADETVFNTAVTAAKRQVSKDTCEPEIDLSGQASGSFTKPGAKQTLIFYQYCQTGNGFGLAGLVLIEDGKVAGNYLAEAGWTVDVRAVADVNKNGLDEFTLTYSGGMHQGMGGTGVDLMEFSDGMPKGIGWYKAEEFGPTESASAWMLTAKPGAKPVFSKQKYASREGGDYKKVGAATPAKLTEVISKFTAVK